MRFESCLAPRSNGSAREPSRPDPARGGETPVQPHRVHPPEGRSSSLGAGRRLRARWSGTTGRWRSGDGGRTGSCYPSPGEERAVREPSLAVRNGCCQCWFAKGSSRGDPPGKTSVDVCDDGGIVVAEALVCARQRPPQFPLRPYNTRQRNDDQLTRHERIARKHDCRTTGPRDHAHPAPPKRSKSMTRWVVPGTRPTRSDSSSRPSCSRRSRAATDENAKGQEATVDAVMRGEKPAPSA